MNLLKQNSGKLFTILFIAILLFVAIYDYNGKGEGDNIQKFDVRSDIKIVSGVPLIEVYPSDRENLPLVILQHGFKNKKESMLKFGKSLADQGFFVICPDAYAHGARDEEGANLLEIIVRTAEEYDGIIGHYETDKRVDVSRLGISGFSMGGCICFYYTAYGKYKPKAIAPTITTPYFQQLIGTQLGRSGFSSGDGLYVEEDPEQIERINQFTREHSPFKDYKVFGELPVLMQNGEEDTYVTNEGVEKLMRAVGNDNPNMKLIYIPGARHQVTEDMKDNIREFFVTYL